MAERIVELLSDPDRRTRMGEFGRRRIENELEWRLEAPKLLAAYDALFAGERIATAKPRWSTASNGSSTGGRDSRRL
jgi:hypothetical protein